jgi:hypothetical protein
MDEWRCAEGCVAGDCVEVRVEPDGVAIRDSKDPQLVLLFTLAEWRAFTAGVKSGEFDL